MIREEIKEFDKLLKSECKKRGISDRIAEIRQLYDRALTKICLADRKSDFTEPRLAILLQFCIGEFLYVENYCPDLLVDSNLLEGLAIRATEKFVRSPSYANEEPLYTSLPLYDVRISTLHYAISVLEEINSPLSKKNFTVSLINDIFETTFKKIDGFSRMMMLGLYPDALAAWRTLHESECFIKLLITGGDKVRYSYIDHIYYSNAYVFQDNFSKEELDQTFAELKEKMTQHGLKSKDMKKFIDYGWLFSHPKYDPEDKQFKLNFRDGVERLAGERNEETNEVYGFTSEITHSSAIFYYVNDELCKNLALTYTYKTVIHIIELYLEYMSNYFHHNKNQLCKIQDCLKDMRHISANLWNEYMKPSEEQHD